MATTDHLDIDALPEGDVIRLLVVQHLHVRECLDRLVAASGAARTAAFDELRVLLAMHETAEEIVLRPVSRDVHGNDVADARNAEEHAATELLSRLEDLDVDSAEFGALAEQLRDDVVRHAEAEEREEFPRIVDQVAVEERQALGTRLLRAERAAPTRPHPSTAGAGPAAHLLAGPLVAVVDRVRDALSGRPGRLRP